MVNRRTVTGDGMRTQLCLSILGTDKEKLKLLAENKGMSMAELVYEWTEEADDRGAGV